MKFVILTGMSGAGKSTAIKMMEDIGYYCVDNLPIALLEKFVELSSLQEMQNCRKWRTVLTSGTAQALEEIRDVLARIQKKKDSLRDSVSGCRGFCIGQALQGDQKKPSAVRRRPGGQGH